jgi:hypothetical protein
MFKEEGYNSANFGYMRGDQDFINKAINLRTDILLPDQNQYCIEWAKNYWIGEVVLRLSGVLIGLINGWLVKILDIAGALEKRETVDKVYKVKFIKKTISQFITLSIIILIVNFGIFEDKLFGFISFFNGNYTSFDKRFYHNIGITLQTALMM